MKFKKYLLLFTIIFIFFFSFSFASAGLFIDGKDVKNKTDIFRATVRFDDGDVGSLAASIIGALLSLLGIIFIGLIIYAGFNWMTASGEEEKIKKAQDTIKRAIIGLIIILSAYAITYFVFNNFFTGKFGGGASSGGSKESVTTNQE